MPAPRLLLLLGATALLACEPERDRSPGIVTHPDAATAAPDTGVPPPDAGAQPDATEPPDSGAPTDGGADPMDAGIADTGGAPRDGGVPVSGPSAGCGMAQSTGISAGTINVGGTDRTYTIVVPADYDPNTPVRLIFGWHGSGSSGDRFRRGAGEGIERNFPGVYVYPDGLFVTTTNSTGWVLSTTGRDMALFDALYADITARYCIQLDKVYQWGFSFGGYMTNLVGCARGARFAGFVEMSGGPVINGCQAPVPGLMSHGEQDNIVPFSQGTQARDIWARANGCQTTTQPTTPSPCVEFTGCSARTVWCDYPNMGHDFPPMSIQVVSGFFNSL